MENEQKAKKQKAKLKKGSKYIRQKYNNQKILILHNEFIQIFCITRNEIQETKDGLFASRKIYNDNDLSVEFTVEMGEIVKMMNQETKQIVSTNGIRSLIDRAIDQYIIFARQSYLMYCILFDYYYNNQEKLDNDYLIITVKEIHQMYRNKTLNQFRKIDEDTLMSYQKGIEDLHNKKIKINLEKIKLDKDKRKKQYIKKFPQDEIEQNLIDYELIKNDKNEILSIKYKLGAFGKLMLSSKKMSTIVPVELIQVPYKEINKFYIGMYLAKLIFMTRKSKKKYKVVKIKNILKNVMCFNLDGSPKGINKYQEIKQAEQKTRFISNFEKQLKWVLDLFCGERESGNGEKVEDEEMKIIKDYQISVDKINSKNYDLESTTVKITIR